MTFLNNWAKVMPKKAATGNVAFYAKTRTVQVHTPTKSSRETDRCTLFTRRKFEEFADQSDDFNSENTHTHTHTHTHTLEFRDVEDSGSGALMNGPCGSAACQPHRLNTCSFDKTIAKTNHNIR